MRSLENAFGLCTELKSLDLSGWDVSNVATLSGMFWYSRNIKDISFINDWNVTSNLTDMSLMFYGCEKIENLDLSKWDVSNVRYAYDMFENCESLKSVGDISNWQLKLALDMTNMFKNCHNLTTVGDLNKWKKYIYRSNHTKPQCDEMFLDCKNMIIPHTWYNTTTQNIR